MKSISSKFGTAVLLVLSTCALSLAEDAKPAADAGAKRPGRGEGGRGAGRMDPEARANKMKTDLGLTDEQTAKIKAVFEKNQAKNAEEMKKLREDTALSREDKAKKFGEIMAATAEEIKPILTPEQQTKWKEEQEKRREEMKKRREGAGAKPGAAAKPEAK